MEGQLYEGFMLWNVQGGATRSCIISCIGLKSKMLLMFSWPFYLLRQGKSTWSIVSSLSCPQAEVV